MSYNDTEIAKYYKEQGLPNPYETYSPDLLASRDTLSREGYNVGKAETNRAELEASMKALLGARARNDPAVAARPNMVSTTPLAAEVAASSNLDKLSGADFNAQANEWMAAGGPNAPGGTAQAVSLPSQPKGKGTLIMDQMMQQNNQRAAQRAYVEAILARKKNDKSRAQTEDDKYAQLERDRMMQLLTKQGYTPFNDVNRARQGNVYGM
jgi:hypothetical protein